MGRLLIDAICSGNETLARDLVQSGTYGCVESQTSRRDGTALFFCCSAGYFQLAEMLIARGANVHSRNSSLATPLHAAADHGHMEIVKLLLAHGAEVDAQNHRGDTPLHLAAFRGHGEIIQYLVDVGADFRLINSLSMTAENEARGQQNMHVAKYLRAAHQLRYPGGRQEDSSDSMISLDPPQPQGDSCTRQVGRYKDYRQLQLEQPQQIQRQQQRQQQIRREGLRRQHQEEQQELQQKSYRHHDHHHHQQQLQHQQQQQQQQLPKRRHSQVDALSPCAPLGLSNRSFFDLDPPGDSDPSGTATHLYNMQVSEPSAKATSLSRVSNSPHGPASGDLRYAPCCPSNVYFSELNETDWTRMSPLSSFSTDQPPWSSMSSFDSGNSSSLMSTSSSYSDSVRGSGDFQPLGPGERGGSCLHGCDHHQAPMVGRHSVRDPKLRRSVSMRNSVSGSNSSGQRACLNSLSTLPNIRANYDRSLSLEEQQPSFEFRRLPSTCFTPSLENIPSNNLSSSSPYASAERPATSPMTFVNVPIN